MIDDTYATALGVEPTSNLLSVLNQAGHSIAYYPRRLAGMSAYREVAHGFSIGDKIQFTAPDKSLGVANRERSPRFGSSIAFFRS